MIDQTSTKELHREGNAVARDTAGSRAVRIALVGQSFFSYVQAIRDEVRCRGYYCSFFDERHSNSIAAKMAYRLRISVFVRQARDRHLLRIMEEVKRQRISDLCLINIEAVTPEFVTALRSNGVRVHLYMWDSARNRSAFPQLLPMVNGRSSFEPKDCETYGLTYIPLFAEQVFRDSAAARRGRELVFLGTLHSRRGRLLIRIESDASSTGFAVKKMLYYHSRALYAIKCIFSPALFRYFTAIQSRPFTKAQIATAYGNAMAVLDIQHPGQEGLTARTFEALRAGARVITFNKTALSLPAALRQRVIVLANIDELKERLKQINDQLPALDVESDHFLSLARFTDELLQVGGIAPVAPA